MEYGAQKRIAAVAIALSALLFLCGCQPALQVSAAPEAAPVHEIAYEEQPQEPINPVFAFYDGFCEALKPYIEEMDKELGVMYSLELNMHAQRLQHFFLAPSELLMTDEETWDGVLAGALSGSGTVSGDESSCRFSLSLWDGTRIDGRIYGDTMEAEWKYPETIEVAFEPYETEEGEIMEPAPESRTEWHMFRSAKIVREDGEYEALVDWDGEYAHIMLEEKGIYFSGNAEGGNEHSSWSYINGEFMAYTEENEEQQQ